MPPHGAFTPYPGGLTVWSPRSPRPPEDYYYQLEARADANTPHHSWYRFTFPEDAWLTFQTRQAVPLPGEFRNKTLQVKPVSDLQSPSIVVMEYGVPEGGDGSDPPPIPPWKPNV